MGFKDIEIKEEYRSNVDNVARDFYYPVLQNAVTYDRAVGFFSSTALIAIADGLFPFIKKGGKMRIIASPKLSKEDIEAIEKGYELREKIIENAVIRELYKPENHSENNRLKLLAKLIADNRLDIKLAIVGKYGLYHEKMGIFTDDFGMQIAFSGSMNESYTAMSINYESIDVYCSWMGESDYRRTTNKTFAFEKLWLNQDEDVEVLAFESVKKEIIQRFNDTSMDYEDFIEEDFFNGTKKEDTEKAILKGIPCIPQSVSLYDYQLKAIKNWENCGYKGIFDMATGTGKTYTGIAALCSLFEKKKRLIAVIVCPLTHLVEQWVEDLKYFNMQPIVAYGIPKYKNFALKVRQAIFDYNLKTKNFVCIICTKETFVSQKLQEQLIKAGDDLLLLVDEAHNMGAKTYIEKLTDKYKYRLALSATFERHNDDYGTKALFQYFGTKCISYTLEQAIQENKLTPYNYYPILVFLSNDELEIFNELSKEIRENLTVDKQGHIKLNERGKKLAIKRARVVAGAEMKIDALLEHIRPYQFDNHILIYCGATKSKSEDMEDDIRQIDLITQKLGLEIGMKVAQFTSNENSEHRELLKNEFADGSNLQALVAIKCLDEGVNIPAIKTAFILASTTNPKEYIQRRGRVLRLSSGKKKAYIYDFVTLPHNLDIVPSLSKDEIIYDLSLVKTELARVLEFQRLADNSYESLETIQRIKEAYQMYGEDEQFGEEFE